MSRTAVPKAAIDENRYLIATEHEISSTSQFSHGLAIYAIAQTQSVGLAPHGNFRMGVFLLLADHPVSRID